ncbi:SANT/Myb_domain [Hexamita inflata]|uniref:SANT/Myb domain n=1 Tax=Hexamita inflata TaxID=28002 RepID=A0AA86PUA2_9EUKA|nr:SANT/Myb domain [Hexamita inflata]
MLSNTMEWTEEEKQLFAYLAHLYKENIHEIAQHLSTKTYNQIQRYYRNNNQIQFTQNGITQTQIDAYQTTLIQLLSQYEEESASELVQIRWLQRQLQKNQYKLNIIETTIQKTYRVLVQQENIIQQLIKNNQFMCEVLQKRQQ